MTKVVMPLVLSFAFTAAASQDPQAEPSLEDLSRLLLQQKEIIETQTKELEAVRQKLSEVEALALSSHNRLQEIEQKPAEPSAEVAMEERLAQLVKRIPPKVPFTAKQGSQLALGYVAAGDTKRALNALLRTRDDGSLAASLKDPGFDPIRGEPRFRDILRAVAPDGQ